MSMAGSTGRETRNETDNEGASGCWRGSCLRARRRSGDHARAGAGQDHHAVLGRVGPRQCAGRTVEGLHHQDRNRHEVRIRAVDQLCRSFPERTQFAWVVVRSHHRRFPMDRRRRGERPVRQAQRFLQEGRNQHGRLHAGDGGRLFRMAEELAELLGAAGHGRCGRLDLSQGLVCAARRAEGFQGQIRPRSRRAENAR